MLRRPPRSTQSRSSAASDVYKRQAFEVGGEGWDDEAVTTFPTFGEAVLAFAEAAFVETDDDLEQE